MDWVAYTLEAHFSGRKPLANCLSLGCGTGHLERTMVQYGVFEHCDAYDVSEASVRIARELASKAGIDAIDYHVADINTLVLEPARYDAVWVNAAMHHFLELEHILSQIHRTLRPEGLLILNEYVGPNRFQFSQRQKEIGTLCLNLLPRRYRQLPQVTAQGARLSGSLAGRSRWAVQRAIDKMKDGDLLPALYRKLRSYTDGVRHAPQYKTEVLFPSERDVIAVDPSEGIRSSDIILLLNQHFSVVEKKDVGLNILQFLLADIAGNFADENPESQSLLRMLIAIEDTLLDCREFESDFVYVVARPRQEDQA